MKILMPLPKIDFDPSESALPWELLTHRGHDFTFATPDGSPGEADKRMIDGNQLGLFKSLLMAASNARSAYEKMKNSKEFQNPLQYEGINIEDYDAVIFPGGHAPGMREYLDSPLVQNFAVKAFRFNKVVGAVCHGILAISRAKDPETGNSLLYGKKTTALLAQQENLAVFLTKRRLGDYYRTYPGTTVQEEVTNALKNKDDFLEGPLPILRDNLKALQRGFVCVDGNYVSARWPGDVYSWSLKIHELLEKRR